MMGYRMMEAFVESVLPQLPMQPTIQPQCNSQKLCQLARMCTCCPSCSAVWWRRVIPRASGTMSEITELCVPEDRAGHPDT
eukprot:1157753-Pelagomonas_calceolata.AAC.5